MQHEPPSQRIHRKREASPCPDLGTRFKDLREIARGSYGTVYIAKDALQNDKECVVKLENL